MKKNCNRRWNGNMCGGQLDVIKYKIKKWSLYKCFKCNTLYVKTPSTKLQLLYNLLETNMELYKEIMLDGGDNAETSM